MITEDFKSFGLLKVLELDVGLDVGIKLLALIDSIDGLRGKDFLVYKSYSTPNEEFDGMQVEIYEGMYRKEKEYGKS